MGGQTKVGVHGISASDERCQNYKSTSQLDESGGGM